MIEEYLSKFNFIEKITFLVSLLHNFILEFFNEGTFVLINEKNTENRI